MLFSDVFITVLIWVTAFLGFAKAQETYDRGPLQELSQFRQQHRFAEGKLCAGVFVQNNLIFTDCTDTPNPEGRSGREWCWFEGQLLRKDEKNWGYCSPVIDYNLVRAKANEAFQAKANEVQKMIERLDTERSRLDDIISRYKATCGAQHDSVAARLGKIESLISRTDRSIVKIEETTEKIGSIQETIAAIQDQVEKERSIALKAPENCAVVPGYEDDPFPDGIRGAYFKNPMFRGAAVYRIDEEINFQWTAKDPMPGIPNEGFSVRWDGFIQAPYSGEYTFSIEADCGARVFLNNDPIIVDRMPIPSTKATAEAAEEIAILPPSDHDGPRKIQAPAIQLNAGEKNSIRVEMMHSSHLRWSNSDDASIKLMWATSGIKEQTVPPQAFYQSNVKPPLKISGLNPADFEITLLYDGEFAYKGSTNHFFADVPLLYHGSPTIRAKDSLTVEKLTFEVNIPAELYICAPLGTTSPFSPCEGTLHDTGDILSVYEAESRNTRARVATHFTIYKIEIGKPGHFSVDLLKPGTSIIAFLRPKKDTHAACGGKTFMVSDPTADVYESCEASSSLSPEYDCQYGLKSLTADQPYGTWKSTGGNGVGEFVIIRFKRPVQLTELRFKPLSSSIFWPSELTLYFTETNVDADTQSFTVVHSSNMDAMKFSLIPVVTTYVKIEVSRMYVNGENTGGSFQLMGTECHGIGTDSETELVQKSPISPSEQVPTNPTSSKPAPTLISIQTCKQNIEDLSEARPIESGKTFSISCPVQCLNPVPPTKNAASFLVSAFAMNNAEVSMPGYSLSSLSSSTPEELQPVINTVPDTWRVFGAETYAPESDLCAAAVHAGVCSSSSEQPCTITVELIPGRSSFVGDLRNGIQSQAHGPSEISISFTAQAPSLPPNDVLNVKYGISFRAVDNGPIPQGYHIDDGTVMGRKDPTSDLMFGWERPAKIVRCPELNREGLNPLNIGGIEFPPDPTSSACDSGMAECSRNQWTIKLPSEGLYRIEAQVGNPCHPVEANGVSLVSDEILAKGQYYWGTKDVYVSDKTLTLTANCEVNGDNHSSICNTALTTIMNLKIMNSHAHHFAVQ